MLKKLLKASKGFTLIELVMVIVIIGILAAVAIPKYVDLQSKAKNASQWGTVGGVRAGIGIWHAENLVAGGTTATWPPILDDGAAGATANTTVPFFLSVLDTPITSDWSKVAAEVSQYIGPNGVTFTYDSDDGSFEIL